MTPQYNKYDAALDSSTDYLRKYCRVESAQVLSDVTLDGNDMDSSTSFYFHLPMLTKEDLKLISIENYHNNNVVSYYAYYIPDR